MKEAAETCSISNTDSVMTIWKPRTERNRWMDGGENRICVRVEIGVVFLIGFVMREGRGWIVWCTCRTVAGAFCILFVHFPIALGLAAEEQQRQER